MRQYVINNPIKLAENDNSNTITNDYSDSKYQSIKIQVNIVKRQILII